MAVGTENIYQNEGPTYASPASGGVRIMGSDHTTSVIPDSSADGLTAGYIVERHPVNTNRVKLASNGSITWRGILIDDQYVNVDGTYNHTKPLCILIAGQGRVYSGEALAADILYCSDATGRARTYVAGVDNALSVIGRTKTSCTAAGDKVDVTVEGGG